MADYAVYQNQWLFVTLFGGSALVLMVVLCYWALWRPRREEREAEEHQLAGLRSWYVWLRGIFPWAIVLAAVGTLIYTVVHTGVAALKTPNW